MRDPEDTTLTLASLLADGVPAEAGLTRETEEALRAVWMGEVAADPRRQRSVRAALEEHALAWRKWGEAYVRDTVAWLMFCAAKLRLGDDHEAGLAAEAALPAVDWEAVDRLFRENWEAHRAERRRAGTDRGIASDIAHLAWALGKRGMPGVREPGDLFKRMTEQRGQAS
jgi:hypothetical protein